MSNTLMNKKKAAQLLVPKLPRGYFFVFYERPDGCGGSVEIYRRVLTIFRKSIWSAPVNVPTSSYHLGQGMKEKPSMKKCFEETALKGSEHAEIHWQKSLRVNPSVTWAMEELAADFEKNKLK